MRGTARTNEKIPLNVLIVEDSEDDAILLVNLLTGHHFDVYYKRVFSPAMMQAELEQQRWDMVISDFHMPNFSGFDALNILKSADGGDIPFIVVSGVVGEEKAVEMMLAGAHDYVLKHDLTRLVPAIHRELQEAENRRQRRAIERELEQYRNHLEDLVQDRTRELQTIQYELLQKERMALLGQLVGTVSHELCNPLGVIRNAVYLLGRKLQNLDQQNQEYLTIIEREVESAHQIISNLLEATRAKEPYLQQICLDDVVLDVVNTLALPESLQFHYLRNPKPFFIYADRVQFRQVLNNLLTNSVQAIGKEGHIIVQAYAHNQQDIITVVDTGKGIPVNAKDNIFEPLFTTKAKGTGLGLWISREILHRHKGKLQYVDAGRCCSSHPALELMRELPATEAMQPGACFEIVLPQASIVSS